MHELHIFAGAGGGILGGKLLGHTCVCAVEIEPYCRKILLQRQRDGILPRFPIWDDVQTFDGKPWRGRVDVVCGGFPCQDISSCGRGEGINGARSGLWSHMARIIGEVRPHYVFVENSPMLTLRGLGRVLGDLAAMGYDAKWGVLGAIHTGALHKRERIWIFAFNPNTKSLGSQGEPDAGITAISRPELKEQLERLHARQMGLALPAGNRGGITDGVANRMDRLKALGNGQVPAVVKLAWEELSK